MALASGGIERIEHRVLGALPSRGPATAPVIIELFLSPNQNPRADEYKALEALQARHPKQIRLVYRILKAAGTARWHYAALEAHSQGKFEPFMDEIRSTAGPLTTAQLVELAHRIELDQQRLTAVLSHPPPSYDRVLDDNLRRLRRKLRASPPFVLMNGRPLRDGSTLPADLERQYRAALQQAAELLDRGADPWRLADAFDAAAAPNPLGIAVPIGTVDGPTDDVSLEPRLATPALDFSGWPSLGPVDAPVIVAVLCNPTSIHCAAALRAARSAQDVFSDSVRLVWAPYAIANNDAGLTATAATLLCAEAMPAVADDFVGASSRGWRWIEAIVSESSQTIQALASSMLDRIADVTRTDQQALASCQNQRAGAVSTWIARARAAGARTSPSMVINGRIYPAITESRPLQQLIESELSPGDCDGCLHLDDLAPTWRRH